MKKIPLGLISILLWAISVSVFLYFFFLGNVSKSIDGRVAIHLNPEERNLVLTEMRGLLASINGIVSALAEEDYQKAELAASASGMAMVKKLEDEERTILLKLPIEFKQLGFGTHDQFDKIAEDLRQKKNTKVILRELDKLTQNCVRCHATYKIEF